MGKSVTRNAVAVTLLLVFCHFNFFHFNGLFLICKIKCFPLKFYFIFQSFFMYIVLAKYIQNQNIVIPNVVIGLVANGVNALLHYILLYQLNMSTE